MRHPRLIISTEGMEGCGKSKLGLSMPRGDGSTVGHGLAYLDFDFGLEGVDGEPPDIHHHYDMLAAEWKPEAEAKRYAQGVMKKFIADFREALAKPVRSLVVDTFTAAWAGQRLARGDDDKYVAYEEEFRSLIRAAYTSPHTNVLLIHHLARDWKRNTAGKAYKAESYSRDGMDGIANMVQLAIRQRYTPPQIVQGGLRIADGKFEIDVLKCRDNIGLVGTTWPGMDFASLGSIVCPTVDWSK